MKALRILSYIGAAILIFFGILFILAAFGESFSGSWLLIGFILLGIGFILIIIAATLMKPKVVENRQVILNVDLPGNVKMEGMKCRQCGGQLATKDINMVNGAPMVSCPYCNSIYQLTEEPKW